MRDNVSYELDQGMRVEIAKIKEIIKSYLHNANVYLFGSIAKGCYSKSSDVDLLILVSQDMEIKQLRVLRHKLEDMIEDAGISRTVDLKLYTADRYLQLSQRPCFEQVIQKDLINIEKW